MHCRALIAPLLLLALFFAAYARAAAGVNEFEGLIEPFEIVNVGSPVEGVVQEVLVERSGLVRRGDPLVRLESSVEEAALKRARATAAVEGEIRTEEARLTHARRQHGRIAELFKSEAISAEKKDEAATEVTLSTARLKKAREDKEVARLEAARAQALLDQRTIRSPIDGVVVERLAAPGEFVDDKPLLRLADLDPLRVEVILPAALFRTIAPGMDAEVRPDGPEAGSHQARVTIVDRVIDPASNTFGVRLELPNPDYRLPSGLKCTVRFAGVTAAEPLPAAATANPPAVDPRTVSPAAAAATAASRPTTAR